MRGQTGKPCQAKLRKHNTTNNNTPQLTGFTGYFAIRVLLCCRGDKLVFGEERDSVWDDRAHPQHQEAPWMPKPEEGKPTVNFFRNAKDKRA